MKATFATLRDLLGGAGYEFVEPPILQDADLFLDLAGEDLRRRLFLTPQADGVELCLRPDYTIPVCLHHLTKGAAKREANYAYLGPVFRQRAGETGEFYQAGVESIGRTDRLAADAETLALALEAAGHCGVKRPRVRIGDSALFLALIDALAIPNLWRRRLARAFGDNSRLTAIRARLAGAGEHRAPAHTGFLAALEGADHNAARHVVEDLLTIAGIRPVGGRTAGEIAERFLEQAAMQAGTGVDERVTGVLAQFLAIKGTPNEALDALSALARKEELDFGAGIEAFERRIEELDRAGLALDRIEFAADFGRRLDYYTGFVFEMHDPKRGNGGPIVGGGRYDRLLSLITNRDGSGEDVPAVGFALWLDRLGIEAGS